MTLRIPDAIDPVVSIVMVTHGRWRWARASIAAAIERTAVSFEVIVVDNASEDETAERLGEVENARVILNEENRGFGPASNQGAAVARGRQLVFLNSDAVVNPGWLPPLLELVERPEVSAAVPRFLNSDGSLQEAGALLARDGTVTTYGEGDDPRRPRYLFRRVIDFGAAACLVVDKAAFDASGGFDAVYAPAYYEDVDLCLRLADAGGTVVYEPRSTVTHVRFGSGDRERASALHRRNRHIFLDRWGDRLASRPWTLAAADARTELAARDALATPRIFVCDDGATRDGDGAASRVVSALADAWPRARISWLTGAFDPRSSAAAAWLHRGIELVDDDVPRWLGERHLFYDVVVVGRVADPRLPEAARAFQPQARLLPLETLDVPADRLADVMAAAGVG